MCYVHNQWYDISCATLYKISHSLTICSYMVKFWKTHHACEYYIFKSIPQIVCWILQRETDREAGQNIACNCLPE